MVKAPNKRRNWPLLLGSAIVLLVVLAAMIGPAVAPRDPLVQVAVVKIGGRYYPPPFPPFADWRYPLGSDRVGRDMLSQLLWGIRPTLILIAVVAAVRLLLGFVVGLTAGWARGWPGSIARSAIVVAQSVPVLIIALAVILIVGVERGLLAFIVGMALTGWYQTARLVEAQTRVVAGQQFVSAAQALGSSSFAIVTRHILRHTLPLGGMLLAFEAGATLLLAGALGFLGYFIGGGTLVPMDDGITRNVAEMPELGQLLSTAAQQTLKPGPMAIVGFTVFVMVLGFNLLGEGLRREAQRVRPPSRAWRWFDAGALRLEDAAARHTRSWGRALLACVLLALLAGGYWLWQNERSAAPIVPTAVALAPTAAAATIALQPTATPEPPLWAGEGKTAQGTLWLADAAALDHPTVSWIFTDTAGFAGGPVVAADGTVYLASLAGDLYAFDASGKQQWQASAGSELIGGPALAPDGTIYMVERGGAVVAFDALGNQRWRFRSSSGQEATSGPVVGADGTVYYTVQDRIQAVTADGKERWLSPAVASYLTVAPLLNAAGDMVFVQQYAFSARDGAPVDLKLEVRPDMVPGAALLVGANGQNYYLASTAITEWQLAANGAQRGRSVDFGLGMQQAGVTTSGDVWAHCVNNQAVHALCWDTAGEQSLVVLSDLVRASDDRGHVRVIGVTSDDTVYVCGAGVRRRSVCKALSPRAAEPLWEVELADGRLINGGAFVPGRLYVTTAEGYFYAIGDHLAAK